MKLNQILIQANQFERSKFINCLDRICSTAKEGDPELAKKLEAFDGQLKQASEAQVSQLFLACIDRFRDFVRHELSLQGGQVALLVNILARDGNCLAREVWIEQLYAKEHARMIAISESIRKEIDRGDRKSIGLGKTRFAALPL